MVIQKKDFFVVFLLLLISTEIIAKSDKNKAIENWELARKTEDISIFYRWISTDSLKTREMRAQFIIRAEIPAILHQFSEAENYKSWAVGIKECRIDKIDDSSWVTYTLMNYPWPFKQKDLVTRHLVNQIGSETTIYISAQPDFYAEKAGVDRMKNYLGEWRFSLVEKGITTVDYRVVSFSKPVFPRFIQDPVIQKLFIDSFHELKYLAESK
jgi:hypothetical protein